MRQKGTHRQAKDIQHNAIDTVISQEIEQIVQDAKIAKTTRAYESVVREALTDKAEELAFKNNKPAVLAILERIAQEIYPEDKLEERIARYSFNALDETEFYVDIIVRAHQLKEEDKASRYFLRIISPQKLFDNKVLLADPKEGIQNLDEVKINMLFTYGRGYFELSRKEGLAEAEKEVLDAYAKIFITTGIRNSIKNMLLTQREGQLVQGSSRLSLLEDTIYHARLIGDQSTIAKINELFDPARLNISESKLKIRQKIDYRIIDQILDKEDISEQDKKTLRHYVNAEYQSRELRDQTAVDRLINAAWTVGEADKDTQMLHIGEIYIKKYYPKSRALGQIQNKIRELR